MSKSESSNNSDSFFIDEDCHCTYDITLIASDMYCGIYEASAHESDHFQGGG